MNPARAGDASYHRWVLAFLPVLVTAGWVALIVVTPLLPGWAGAFVYGLGSFICHQLPERSFHLAGFQLPVCARCLGIYIGVSAGAAYVWMRARNESLLPMRARDVRRLAAIAAMPTLLTVALEMMGLWYPSNNTRALAGVPLGVLVGVVVTSALARAERGPGDAVPSEADPR
jgi:uncharacterized membrane protein